MLFVAFNDRVELRGLDLLVRGHIVVNLLIGDVAHLIVALMADGQQTLCLPRVEHEIGDELPVARHLLISRIIQRH